MSFFLTIMLTMDGE